MGRSADVFLHRYGERPLSRDIWSAVDTRFAQAKNIVNYLRIIHRILAPGGVWINLGMVLTLSICMISSGF